jgi:hypothetical protein
MVAQAGISSFIQWYDDPASTPWIAADVFGVAPRELLRSVSLTQTLQLIKVTVEVVEERVKGRDESLREAILLYSREIAFGAADVYARAAEARGLWDARLEALVVDSILSGEYDDELPSRIAALGWHGHGEVSVLVGTAPAVLDVDMLRRTARHLDADVLIGVQGSRLVLVIGRALPAPAPEQEHADAPLSFLEIARALEPGFGDGHLVLGHEVATLVDANRSAKAALAGDPLARATLINRVYRPLAGHASELLTTLWAYLDNGRSLEATARELFVHPNTVRYRLKRVSDVIGYDATGARESLILQAALIIGSIAEPDGAARRR